MSTTAKSQATKTNQTTETTTAAASRVFFTWATRKQAAGNFKAIATQCTPQNAPLANGHYCKSETIWECEGYATRAKAKRAAVLVTGRARARANSAKTDYFFNKSYIANS